MPTRIMWRGWWKRCGAGDMKRFLLAAIFLALPASADTVAQIVAAHAEQIAGRARQRYGV